VAKRDAAIFRLRVLRDMAGDPTSEFDLDDFTHAKRNLTAIIDECTAKLDQLRGDSTIIDLPESRELLDEYWDRIDISERRALIRLCVTQVILKAPGRGKRFAPTLEHIEPVWRVQAARIR
jgi:hypothetical protein